MKLKIGILLLGASLWMIVTTDSFAEHAPCVTILIENKMVITTPLTYTGTDCQGQTITGIIQQNIHLILPLLHGSKLSICATKRVCAVKNITQPTIIVCTGTTNRMECVTETRVSRLAKLAL